MDCRSLKYSNAETKRCLFKKTSIFDSLPVINQEKWRWSNPIYIGAKEWQICKIIQLMPGKYF